jgi:DNA-binding transcriptional LysR family regulator
MQRRPAVNNVPIELLRAIVAIEDLGSFTKAAQALKLTQPAISAQMKRLQQLVGAEVFSKSGSGLVLTDRGELVVRYARRMLAMNDQILSLGGGQAHTRLLRLGLPLLFAREVLHKVLKIEAQCGHDTEIQILCESSDELRRRLGAGYIDIAFFINPTERPPQIAIEWTEPWVWVGAPALTLNKDDKIPLIVTPSDRFTIEFIEKTGRPYVVRFMAPSLGARLDAMRAGVGFMGLAARLVTDDMQVITGDTLPTFPDTAAGVYLREGLEAGSIADVLEAFITACKPATTGRPAFTSQLRSA